MKRRYTITTPEGIALGFRQANLGDRFAAFSIDMAIIFAVVMAAFLVAWTLGGTDVGFALALLVSFLVRTFYFTAFEWRRRGRTPGKRRMGLRVVDARGGVLTPAAVVARNLTRELETFLPLVAVFSPELLVPGGTTALRWFTLAWLILFGLLPVITRDRLRLGDIVAGTRVVAMPSIALLPDLSQRRTTREAVYTFTPAQLQHYGNHELHVLEDVLRRPWVDPSTLRVISEKIRNRIGWDDADTVDARLFLEDFYAAQRAGLERGLLFGRRHADKAAARASASGERP